MPREELIASAVQFLRDPSVASATGDKKTAFLKAKNLTQEEIDAAFARAGSPAPNIYAASINPNEFQNATSQRFPPGYGSGNAYGPFQAGPWAQPIPQQPGRDWRDWFVMATVTSGLGYGLYTAAKRYIVPLIAPPTPHKLEQDKAAIDEQFNRAFALIDQIATDTAGLKAAEAERATKLDESLKDIDTVVADLKAANLRRDTENRAIADQVRELKTLVPEALQNWKSQGDARLDDLAGEVASLKKLLENRVGKSMGSNGAGGRSYSSSGVNGQVKQFEEKASSEDRTVSPSPQRDRSTSNQGLILRESPNKGFSSGVERKAAIPAWQMSAASKKPEGEPST